MGGFSSVTGDEAIVFADNASFDGTQRGGKMTTNGQLWIGSTASRHVKLGSLTSPNGTISIGYSSPNITLDTTGPNVKFIDEAVSFPAVSNNGYFITAALTATLPASPSQGDRIQFIVDTTGAFVIQANTGQYIRFANQISSSAGTFTNSLQGDAVVLIYRTASTTWYADSNQCGAWSPA